MIGQTVKNNIGLITRSEAIDLLPFGRRGFESLIKKGEIGFKKVNNRLYFLKSDIEKWSEKLEFHSDCTNVAKSSTRTIRLSAKREPEYSLEKVLAEQRMLKLNNTQLKELRNSNKKTVNK